MKRTVLQIFSALFLFVFLSALLPCAPALADYAVRTYYIYFDANGGNNAPNKVELFMNLYSTLPTNIPKRDGYTFMGWALTSDATEAEYQPGGKLRGENKDVTLYAVWEGTVYTLTYDANGGSGAPESETWRVPVIAVRLSEIKPTRRGYIFKGWAKTANATTAAYQPNGLFGVSSTYNDVTLYAVWTLNTYTVTYYSNGGSGAPDPQSGLFGSTVTLSSEEPVREGYTFLGWSTDILATTAMYAPGDTMVLEENTLLFAVWQSNNYQINYDANGGTGAPASQIKPKDVAVTITDETPSRADETSYLTVTLNANGGTVGTASLTAQTITSYSFTHWNTLADGTGNDYFPGASYTANTSATLYAQWSIATAQQGVTLPTPTRSGYEFMGWNADSGAAGGVKFNYVPNEDVTLYAIWKAETYTIQYDANGGTNAPTSQLKIGDTPVTLSTNTPSRESASVGSYKVTLDANGGSVGALALNAARTESYSFKAWNTDVNGNGIAFAPGAEYTYNSSVVMYAQWLVTTATEAVALPTPVHDGYNFKGWGISANAVSGFTGNYTPSGNITLYAVWEEGTYTVRYDANGGTGAPASQAKANGVPITLSSDTPNRASADAGSYTVTLNANGGNVNATTLIAARTETYTFNSWNTYANGNGTSYAPGATYSINESVTFYAQWEKNTVTAAVTLPTPTKEGYSFKGWGTSASAVSGFTGSYTPSGNITLYAIYSSANIYTVTYDANGGTGTPSAQQKEENVSLTLSSIAPTKSYTIQYNAAGGSVTPASKNVSCVFNGWNTQKNGKGTAYAPGDAYTANADVTLYAQWTNPAAGELAVPVRSGYSFVGWYTTATDGALFNASSTVSGSMTIYARWTDPYNRGDETYSFSNYGDSDSPGGHCFGMSMTSAGYYNNLISIARIGGNASTPLYSFSPTQTVKLPICYYQGLQGSYARRSTVAGGSFYLYGYYSIASDWQEVVSYVRSHQYDNAGVLQIGFRKNYEGGHAINFLRYENVNGQDRIYAYDNNFPSIETYFYRDSAGKVWQAPAQTFSGSIDCIALRDVRTYFSIVGDFNMTHVLYMPRDAARIEGYSYTYMEGGLTGAEYVMYEIPADQDHVVIIPNRDNADFIYMDTEYSFGEITDETRGELTFASMKEGAVVTEALFRILNADDIFGEPDFSLPASLTAIEASAFEGIPAEVVYIPDTCTSIGAYAFKNSAVAQIRIPADCSIASTAFDGCEAVRIFGTPGSAAEAFCDTHENCTFTEE